MTKSKTRTRLAGAAGLIVVGLVVVGLVGQYEQAFTSKVNITLTANRTGLLLDKGDLVRLKGVQVGEVEGVSASNDDATVRVALDPGLGSRIPEGSTALIRATTVFGNKFVDLVPPAHPTGQHLEAGATLPVKSTTIEANDVFQHAVNLLQAVDPGKLNATLTTVATAVSGNGQRLGNLISSTNDYLGQLNPSLKSLGADFQAAGPVIGAYADAAPDLISAASQFSTTSETLAARSGDLQSSLQAVTQAAPHVQSMLTSVGAPLSAALTESVPVTDLLHSYAPEMGCTLNLFMNHRDIFEKVSGNYDATLEGRISFLPGQDPYTYPNNLPQTLTGVGPRCYPSSAEQPNPPFIKWPDGTQNVYSATSTTAVPSDPVVLYGDLLKEFLGDSGGTQLLNGLLGAAKTGGNQ